MSVYYVTIRIIYNLFSSYFCKPHSAPNQYSHPRATCVSMFFRPTRCAHCTCISLLSLLLYTKRSLFYAPLQHACQNMWSVRIFCITILLYLYIRRAFWIVSCYNTGRGWGKKILLLRIIFFFTYITPNMLNLAFSLPCIHIGYMGVGNGVHDSRCSIAVVSIITIAIFYNTQYARLKRWNRLYWSAYV